MIGTNRSCSIQGCLRHSAAVARALGSYSNIGNRNSENFFAASGCQLYFAINRSVILRDFNFILQRKQPKVYKKRTKNKETTKCKRFLFTITAEVVETMFTPIY